MSKYREKYFGKKGSFYDFKIQGSQFSKIQEKTTRSLRMTLLKGFLFGVFFESLIVGLPICKIFSLFPQLGFLLIFRRKQCEKVHHQKTGDKTGRREPPQKTLPFADEERTREITRITPKTILKN